MKYKAVFFDLDDTLCEGRKTKKVVFKRIHNEVKVFFDIPYKKYFLELEKARNDYFNKDINSCFNTYSRIKFWYSLLKNLNLKSDIKTLKELVDLYWKYSYKEIKLFPNVKQVLNKLSKEDIVLALISSGDFYSRAEKLIKLKIDKYFNYIFTSEIVQKNKLNTDIYKYVLKYLNIKASDAVMIGNSVKFDMLPAKEVGFTTICYGKDVSNSKVDYYIEDISEIIRILKI